MTTDQTIATPRSLLFNRLADLERELETIKIMQREILDTLSRIESRQPEVIALDKDIAIWRDEDGEHWLQVGQVGGEISAEEYRQLTLWATCEQPGEPPAVVQELGKTELWRKEFDVEAERLRREELPEQERNNTLCQAFSLWAESLTTDDRH